jgi:Carboxypeptidase regulatory-like domain/TonB dependent receptor-like, beta-barrel
MTRVAFEPRFSRPVVLAMSAIQLALFILCAGAGRADAQALYGSIVGRLTDSTDAGVPGAAVTATHTETSQARTATTSENGVYSFPALPSGTYTVSIAISGFQPVTRRNVNVTISTAVRVDVRLQVNAVSETVDVSAQTVTLQTDRAEVRSELNTRALEELPVPPNRNYQNLFVTIPGFTPPANAHSISANPSRALQFNVNGATRNSNAIRIEGAAAPNVWLPHVAAYVPGLEAIETVSVVTSSLDADQGLAGGAAVNLQMKSGTNEIRGSAFWFHGDDNMKAKPYFLPAGEQKPKWLDDQSGATMGGPIKRNKLFYFASYDGQFDRRTGFTLLTVPTAAMRAGDLSASPNPVYDPATGNADGSGRAAFANNAIPQSRLDPTAMKILANIPLPTFTDRLTNNYFAKGDFSVTRHKYDGKLTWTATNKLNVNGRVGVLDYTMINPPAFGDVGPPVHSAGGREGRGFGTILNGTVSANYTVSPTFLVDTYFGFTRLDTAAEAPRMDENIGRDVLGIPGTNGAEGERVYGGYPSFAVTNYANFGKANSPIYYLDPAYEYVANASLVRGAHNVRFGVNVARQKMDNFEVQGAGSFSFSGGSTSLRGGAGPNQFNSIADFLLGYLSAGNRSILLDDAATSRTWAFSLYARDQWQASRKLTLSYGVRWDYFPMGVAKDRGFQKYDWDTNKMLLCGIGDIPRDCGVEIPLANFSPKLGIAYRPTETLVVRAGFGVNYDPQPLSFVRNLLGVYPQSLGYGLPAPANANVPAGLLKNGLPPEPQVDTQGGIIDIPLTTGFYSPPDDYTMGYIQSWNLTIEKRLVWGLIGQAGYVGSRQKKILQTLNLNAGQVPGAGRDAQPYFQKFGRTADSNIIGNFGDNSYDSLQSTLVRGFANGVQLNASYTWSKAIGQCCDDLSDKNQAIQIPAYMHLNRSLTGYDRTHVFTFSTVSELPFGEGKPFVTSGLGSKLLGNWQVNALVTAYSGTPFSVSAAGTSLNAPGNAQRADQVKADVQILGGTGAGNSYFDPFAFAPVTDARFGTAGFNTVRGPGQVNLDIGLVRNFRIGGKRQVQFRAEALNATNTPHFANPGSNVSNLQLNPDGTIRSLGGYTEITSTTGTGREGVDERVFRLGLRVRF